MFATIPKSNPRKRKAEQECSEANTCCALSTVLQRKNGASAEGGSSATREAANALLSIENGRHDAADEVATEAAIYPDEMQLWKAACVLDTDPLLDELITVLKVQPSARISVVLP